MVLNVFDSLLVKTTGLNISENILARLSHDIAMAKREKAHKVQENLIKIAVTHDVDNILSGAAPSLSPAPEAKPKAKRTRCTSKKAASV